MRLLVTVTFNPNQLRAHLAPLVAIPEVDEVVLVADAPPPPLPKLRAVVPSPRMTRALGRAGSKLVTCSRLARSMRPAWILSYNIMPHGINGRIAGALSGRRTMYHMIGGPREFAGGGWTSDNAILGRLPRAVPPLERGLLTVMRTSTLVGTMGNSGRERLIAEGLDPARVVCVPPSVDVGRFRPGPAGGRPYDLVIVAALLPNKRVGDFLAVVARLRTARPGLRAAIAGDGPERERLTAEARRLGVADAVDFLGRRADIDEVYRSARVFMLTSGSEGLSIAMSEAMASGLPVVVSDVGDLGDVVHEGRGGYRVPVGDVEGFAARAGGLLDDDALWARMSAAAREDVTAHASVERMTDLYRALLVRNTENGGGGA